MLEVLQENESHLPTHEVNLNLSMHANAYYVFFDHHYENANDDEPRHYVDERESECLDVKNFL